MPLFVSLFLYIKEVSSAQRTFWNNMCTDPTVERALGVIRFGSRVTMFVSFGHLHTRTKRHTQSFFVQ